MIYVGILKDWNLGGMGRYYLVDEVTVHTPTTLPQWVQERMAMLRLVEQHTASPIGFWSTRHDGHNIIYRVAATQEEQEEWLRWRGKDLT